MSPNQFGTYIRELRKAKKLSARKLAQLSEVSHSYISQVERGERGVPSPDIIKKLHTHLGISYAELMVKAGHVTFDDWLLTPIPDNDDDHPSYWEEHTQYEKVFSEELSKIQNNHTKRSLDEFLAQPNIYYKHKVITDSDKQRIIDYLDGLFSNRE